MRLVKSWAICDVNGYKFHTNSWSEGRKTYNAGVCVKGSADSIDEITYYGILQEIDPNPRRKTRRMGSVAYVTKKDTSSTLVLN